MTRSNFVAPVVASARRSHDTGDMAVTEVAVIGKHAVLSEAICEDLASFEDLHAVAADSYADDISGFVASFHPDVLVLDTSFVQEDEGGLVDRLRSLREPPAVVLLSNDLPEAEECSHVVDAMKNGVAALVLKMPPTEELALAVRHARRGERWLSPPVLTQVLLANTSAARSAAPVPVSSVTSAIDEMKEEL